MGLWLMLPGSGKVGVTAGRAGPADGSDTGSIIGRRSSVAAPRPGPDDGRAPWHGETGANPVGAVAAVSPDGGV